MAEENLNWVKRWVEPSAEQKALAQKESKILKEDLKPKGYVPTIQERTREKNNRIIADIEQMIDNKEAAPGEFSMYRHLNITGASSATAHAIIEKYEEIAEEILWALSGEGDEQLIEGYSSYSEEDLMVMAMMYQGFVDDATRFLDTSKKLGKIRKKKAVPVEKLIRHFVFAKENADLKIASVDPAGIVKSQELWTFNPKSLELTVFRAVDRSGLNIDKTNIRNYDLESSMTKKISKRKMKETLDAVLSGGKVTLRKMMDSIVSEKVEPKRVTKHTLLLRVMK